MAEPYKEILFSCPTCHAAKKVKIPEAIFSQKKFGTFKIQIPLGAVCSEHQFIAFVDTKGIIRGYEKIDILMAAPSEKPEEQAEGVVTLKGLIDLYGLYGIFCLFHANIFKYPVYIVKDSTSEVDYNNVNNFFDRLLPENYKNSITFTFLDETDYNKIKLEEKSALLIDHLKNIVQTPWEHKLKFEEAIVKKALDIIDNEMQLILIEQNIQNFVKEAEQVKEILEKESVKEIFKKDLIIQLSEDLKIPKINKYRLSLIRYFINQWFSPQLTKKIKGKLQAF